MDNIKQLEFLAAKSKEMVEKQIDSFRHKRTTAGTIIGVVALFIPFFLNGLDNAYPTVQYLSILSIALLILSIILMLLVLQTKPMYQFFAPHKFSELTDKSLDDVLLFEIGANIESFNDNKPIDVKVNQKYNLGIKLTINSIIFSVILLLINNFFQPEKQAIKIHIINCDQMAEKVKIPTPKPKEIPRVPEKDREKLNEGWDKSKSGKQTKPDKRTK